MKTTTFALVILGANSLGVLAIPVEPDNPVFQGCLDSGNTFDECHLAVAVGKRDGNNVDAEPFRDCLDSGKTLDACRLAVPNARRDGPNDVAVTPFQDCLTSGKSFDECRLSQGLVSRSDVTLVERGWDGIVTELGRNWGGQSKCYTADKGHWLTNTAVRNVAKEACTQALKQLTEAGVAIFTKKITGFYDGLLGPVVKPGVKLFFSTYVQKRTGIDFKLDTLGEDLCEKGIKHLADDDGCNTPKKVGVIVSHRAVNGGLFDWTIDGKPPVYGPTGVCSNCILSMVVEA
ncbi:hypothetical protein GP486_006135 [Trichoglossum hirsutum]|uniref:Uncharacterized protein n=1 Tax=Trichoglossum hirsutum TaxID=265104 RepID=A0A9P8L7Y2_9PEZI|nr:hypothetical protein GP486_006135 [Trichoglossum hirsutum]